MTSYDETVACIIVEMDNTAAGDRVEFSVYAGPARYCVSPRHPTHFEPLFLELSGIPWRGEQCLPGPGKYMPGRTRKEEEGSVYG
jgi:hypothetical protein